MKRTVEMTGPVTLTLEPNEVQVIYIALKKLPYENVADLIEKIVQGCQPKAQGIKGKRNANS